MMLAGKDGAYFSRVSFDIELLIDFAALAGPHVRQILQDGITNLPGPPSLQHLLKHRCQLLEVEWHLDFTITYNSTVSWVPDANWKPMLQSIFPNASITNTTVATVMPTFFPGPACMSLAH
jgi:hypothetical protein